MRRFVHPRQVAAFFAFFAAVMAVGAVLKDRVTRATMQEVRAAVQGGPDFDEATAQRAELEGLGLPVWDGVGWRLTGGRSDLLEDDREALTGYYRHRDLTIAYTVLAGTGDVDDGEATRRVYRGAGEGKTELVLGGATGGAKPSESLARPDGPRIRSGLDCTDGCVSSPLRPVLSVKREVGDHTVVLTGWPLTDGVLAAMEDLALQAGA